MKRINFILVVMVWCGLAFGQAPHSFLDERSVLNFNHNWGKVSMDTLHLKVGEDTLALSGNRAGFNVIVQSLDGAVLIKFDGSWEHWWNVVDGSAFNLSGGGLDTLFLKSGEMDSSVVQVMWTAWN